MLKIYFAFILFLLSFSLYSQKKTKLIIFENAALYGVKSGKKTVIPPVFSKVRLEENGLISVKDTIGRWGYFDGKGKPFISPMFIETLPFKNDQALVKKEDGWGIINKEGRFLLKPVYKTIENLEQNTFKVQPFYDVIVFKPNRDTVTTFLTDSVTKLSNEFYGYFLDGKCGLIDTAGNKISLPLYDSIGKFRKNNAVILQERKWGIINSFGKELLPTYYDSAMIDSTGYVRAMVKNNSVEEWFLFNSEGIPMTHSPYSYIDETSASSIFLFKKEGLFGTMDISGREIQKPGYISFVDLPSGYLLRNNHGQGYLDDEGKWKYYPRADSIHVLNQGHIIYSLNKVNYLLDSKGKEIFCTNQTLLPLQEGLVGTVLKGKFGRIDFSGKEILLPVYDSISSLSKDSSLVVFKDKQIGLYNFKRDSLIGPNERIQEIFPISEGFYGVKIKGKFGFVDGLGRIRIANRYEGIGRFQEGMAPVKLLGKWGFVDKAEILRVQPYYDEVEDFQDGIAIVKKEGKYGLINKKGVLLTPFNYDKIKRSDGGYFISMKKSGNNSYLQGVLSPEGKEMIFAKYEDVKINSDGNIIVKKNNKFGVVNRNDLILLSLVFKKIEYDDFSKHYITTKERPAEIVALGENK